MPSLYDLLKKVEAYFLPKAGAYNATRDGMRDPCGNAIVIDPWFRGGMIKGTDGLLYQPCGAGGYARNKGHVRYPGSNGIVATSDDTPVSVTLVSISSTGGTSTVGGKFLSVYQNSGGALTFQIWADNGKTQLLYQQTGILSGAHTLLDCYAIDWYNCYVCWSAAAGATQRVVYQLNYSAPAVEVT